MRRWTSLSLICLLGLGSFVSAAPAPLIAKSAAAARPSKSQPLFTPRAADRFIAKVARRERAFYQPGIAYDAATGMTHDGHETDYETGALRGIARPWSAASKESLHLILLTKALEGEKIAQTLLSPDRAHPDHARAAALSVLTKKIASYEQFDHDYPGYGGFLPWYKVENGKVMPMPDWADRVPGLDNGQLAWSLYVTANKLKDMGETALAARYENHLDKMRKNVVRMFYDPTAHKLRAEAKLTSGNTIAPAKSQYANNVAGYFLDDSYEGLLLNHFADLMGDWRAHPEGKDAIFSQPRRIPVSMKLDKKTITTAKGYWFSAHEDWGYLVLPFRDVPIADALFKNAQRARTGWSAEHGWSGLFASTHQPVSGNELHGYVSALGIPPLGTLPTVDKPIFAPYAAFPLALVDKPLFATWLSTMLHQPGMFGPYGMGESYAKNGDHAPVLTWDGKALPMVAAMGGIGPEVGRLLKRDGLYDQFRARVEKDFSKFDHMKLQGEEMPYSAPPAKFGPN